MKVSASKSATSPSCKTLAESLKQYYAMKQILKIFVLLIIFSCNKIGVSKTEVEAVDKVLGFYGGEVNRSIGFKTANAKKIDYFELK